ncbi:MAG: hypothetical protein LC659_04060, partial [Myxococcales bacterium]|nr:hypothetical protein [Myxococcales bacterium]
QEVRVAEHGRELSVQLIARDQRGAVVGSAQHVVPADDCVAALEVATLIVARAALPLTAIEPRVHKPRSPKPEPVQPPPSAERPQPAPAERPQPAPAERPQPTAAERPQPQPSSSAPPPSPPPKPQVIIIEKSVPTPTPAPLPPGSVLLRLRGPEQRWVGELAAAVYGAFALDGNGTDLPAGELALGFRRGRFGAALRGDIEGDFTVAAPASAASAIKLDIRRAQLALEAHADVGIRIGALRFAVGPTLPLWSVRPSGVAHPATRVIASAGLTARVLYHLDIGRVFVTAGVTFNAALWREELTLTGVGLIARTPLFEVGPIFGFGVNL